MGKSICCKLAFSNVMVRCGGGEVFYSSMVRSQPFGEPVPYAVNFASASQFLFLFLLSLGYMMAGGSWKLCISLSSPMLELGTPL